MTEKQHRTLRNALAWCLGAFTKEERAAIEDLGHYPSLNYLDASFLIGAVINVSRAEGQWEMDREDVRKLLRKYGFKCFDCDRCGNFAGSFCPECSFRMNSRPYTEGELRELHKDSLNS